MNLTSAEITAFIGSYLWPMFRIAGMVMVAPITGARTVPAKIRIILVVAITIVVAPSVPVPTGVDTFSYDWYMITAQQILIGIIIGFIFQLIFATVVTGGLIIAMQMGLGFAQMVDQMNGAQVPVVSQLYLLMVTLLFLVMDGHLLMIKLVVDSFIVIPIGVDGIDRDGYRLIANWGAQLYAVALWVSLPALASLLIINISFGVMARAAPQLNIFAVGFPITMIAGYLVIMYTLPVAAQQFEQVLQRGLDLIKAVIGG